MPLGAKAGTGGAGHFLLSNNSIVTNQLNIADIEININPTSTSPASPQIAPTTPIIRYRYITFLITHLRLFSWVKFLGGFI